MKRLIATMLISTASIGYTTVSSAATAEGKAAYAAAKEHAAAGYKVASDKCNAVTGNPKKVCVAEAKAARVRIEADARSSHEDSLSAWTSARKAIANADYDVAIAKCGSQTGNDKDVCVKAGKAAKIEVLADAKADNKVATARADAADDKRDAHHQVAVEKCDASAGTAKDSCLSFANTMYGK
ncbi:hypothetical protein [Noviherbaspirillum sp.]|uniref:hypothetical protein n=1 Tax=Noviherbaspirillum sp. TaxID=1926288 RepID=UPI002FE12471